MRRVVVLNGPNLNLLGTREPEVYGTTTLAELDDMVEGWGEELGVQVESHQSNHEGALIDLLHEARGAHDGVILNAGALTHYSRALHDAILAASLPTIEVHISNVHAREDWRRISVIGPACDYRIYGRGVRGYRDALRRLVHTAAHPPARVPYGEGPDRFAELRLPDGDGPHPVAVLVHGGFWYDIYTCDQMDGMAVDLADRGWAVWNVEYRRVGNGGGWPATLDDVATAFSALDPMAADVGLDLDRVVAIGHSAGGQLALWSAAQPAIDDESATSSARVKPTLVAVYAAVSDLTMAHELGLGNAAVEKFLRRSPSDGPERYRSSSPRELLPLGVPQVLVHGTEDRAVPHDMSASYTEAARAAGDEAELLSLEGAGHFDVLNPHGEAWLRTVAAIAD